MRIFLEIEVKDGFGDHRTPGLIELWSPNGGPDWLCDHQVTGWGFVTTVTSVTPPRALGLRLVSSRAPLVFCFLFSPPARYP